MAAEAGLVPGKTLFLGPAPREGPDGCAAIFEAGGRWDPGRGEQSWRVGIEARGRTAEAARALAMACLSGALRGFETASAEERGIILDLRVSELPSLEGCDGRGRESVRAALEMTIHAPAA